jgi:hypothetical protein
VNFQQLKSEILYGMVRSGKARLGLARLWEAKLRRELKIGILPTAIPAQRLPGVFVSLTTWAPRLNLLPLTLLTLVRQSVLPEKIVVWITEKDLALLDRTFRYRFEGVGVEFRTCEDLGPHKKWFFTRELASDPMIVLADDDIFYSRRWLELLLSDCTQDNAYIAHRCHRILLRDETIKDYGDWDFECRNYGASSHLLFATGGGGVLFQPQWIPSEFWDRETMMALCPKADDIWLKCAMLSADIKVQKSSSFEPCLGPHEVADTRLEKVNVHQNYNTKQMNDVLDNFSLHHALASADK